MTNSNLRLFHQQINKQMIKIIALLILIVGLVAGVYLVQHPQILKPKAYQDKPSGEGYRKQIPLQKGFAIELSPVERIPSNDMFKLLEPKWVRFVYFADKGIPASIPSEVKILLVLNNEANETVKNVPTHSSTDPYYKFWANYGPQESAWWKDYTDQIWLPFLDEFLNNEQNRRADTLQIWNEQDLCNALTGDCIPADAYAYMLKKSAKKIKEFDTKIKVIMGGVGSGQTNYIVNMKKAYPDVFSQVDAIGLHPYGKSPDGWCQYGPQNQPEKANLNAPECGNAELPYGDLAQSIQEYRAASGLPVWIDEIGLEGSENFQAEYFKRTFAVFLREKIPVAVWFSWSDNIGGTSKGPTKFGLVDSQGTIKEVGVEFRHFGKD